MMLWELDKYIGQLLGAGNFRDYCPNGLQVEGRSEVKKLVSGVSASMELLQAAVIAGADAVLVHHGYFWKHEDARLTGIKRARVAWLLQHDISLIAYHLPLDAHQELGNNAQLAKRMDLNIDGWFGDQNIAAYGRLKETVPLEYFRQLVAQELVRDPLVIGNSERKLRRIAWCSGAAQDYFMDAIAIGVDAFMTGEISEHSVYLARESGIAIISAGHYATERFGVMALGEHLAHRFGLQHQFLDLDNPV